MRPDQADWFTTAIAGAAAGVDFDYDCDGSESGEHEGVYRCSLSPGPAPGTYMCIRPAGETWLGSTPACGAAGTLAQGCTFGASMTCRPVTTTDATQRCR